MKDLKEIVEGRGNEGRKLQPQEYSPLQKIHPLARLSSGPFQDQLPCWRTTATLVKAMLKIISCATQILTLD